MTIPAAPNLSAAPYGAAPVIPVVGPEGGPYNVVKPLPLDVMVLAVRSASVDSAQQTNPGYKGLKVSFRVTVNPGGAQTLSLLVRSIDPNSGANDILLTVPASATPGGLFMIYPGLSGAAVEGVLQTRNLYLPGSWYISMVHSGAGAWTYDVSAELLP